MNVRTQGIRRVAVVAAAMSLAVAACGSDDGESSASETASVEPSDSGSAAETDTASETESSTSQGDEPAVDQEAPTIVVTTNVLGDVVQAVLGDAAEVVTIMPVGADPHDFQPSAQEVNAMNNADALIVNGAGFEEGLLDVIEGAESEGVATFEAISVVSTIDFGEDGHGHSDEEHSDEEHSDEEHSDEEHSDEDHDEGEEHSDEEHSDEEHSDEEHEEGEEHSDEEHSDEEHSDEEHSDEDHEEGEEHSGEEHSDEDHDEGEHDHSGADPHFFTDPTRMASALEGIVSFLQDEVDFADPAALDASAEAYIAELTALDTAVAELVESIPEDRRVLVTSHEVFGYFADRYGFEVVGAVIPGGSTTDSASAGELAELAELVEAEGVPAIFADSSSSDDLVEALAAEVGDITIVDLYTESLGEPDSDGATYLAMVLTNAKRMSEVLA